MKPWSKLQREIYKLIATDIDLQIHCASYRMKNSMDSSNIPRYWITLGKEIIWDYPKHFMQNGELIDVAGNKLWYPHQNEISDISVLIRDYIDTPQKDLLTKDFEDGKWGLTSILKASDRRIGKEKLQQMARNTENVQILKVLQARLH